MAHRDMLRRRAILVAIKRRADVAFVASSRRRVYGPTARSIAWLGVESPQVALEILKLFRASCESRLSGFELMNENQVDLVIQHIPNRRCPLNGHPSWHVLVELSDTNDATALDQEMQTVLKRKRRSQATALRD